LGRPWFDTTNAFIGCQEGEMTISNGLSMKKLTIYPPAQLVIENLWWLECSYENENWEERVLPSDHSWALQEKTTKNVLNQFISAITCIFLLNLSLNLSICLVNNFKNNWIHQICLQHILYLR
jgi:hypothetical protein